MKTGDDELLVQELLADSELPFELPEAPVATQGRRSGPMGEIDVSSRHLGRFLADGTGPQPRPYQAVSQS
ncbi:hypothetical protein [Streptomyces sp. ms184]|uniref:hypothetical protein n=1 Tax=Streptomyces sp. ms184 TaxID=1827974 RepID=UPI000BF19803|nr:hypothetical protein [Streptomyces sp. ms184]